MLGDKGLVGFTHQGPIRGTIGNPTSPEFDRRAKVALEAGPRQSIRGKAMDWRTCSPGEVRAEAARSLDRCGRGVGEGASLGPRCVDSTISCPQPGGIPWPLSKPI